MLLYKLIPTTNAKIIKNKAKTTINLNDTDNLTAFNPFYI